MKKNSVKELGDYLKKARIDAGLTQKQVSIELGYTTSQFVSKWERGLIDPPIETIVFLVKLYKLSINGAIDFLVTLKSRDISSYFYVRKKEVA